MLPSNATSSSSSTRAGHQHHQVAAESAEILITADFLVVAVDGVAFRGAQILRVTVPLQSALMLLQHELPADGRCSEQEPVAVSEERIDVGIVNNSQSHPSSEFPVIKVDVEGNRVFVQIIIVVSCIACFRFVLLIVIVVIISILILNWIRLGLRFLILVRVATVFSTITITKIIVVVLSLRLLRKTASRRRCCRCRRRHRFCTSRR